MSFKRLDQQDITISAESVVAPAWTGQVTTLTSFYTSSTQVGIGAGNYYYDIYQTGSSVTGAEVQFSIVYGNSKASPPLKAEAPKIMRSSRLDAGVPSLFEASSPLVSPFPLVS